MITDNLSTMKPNQALQKGCDLWVIPHPSQSKWSLYLDWYLNFLIRKSENYDNSSQLPNPSSNCDDALLIPVKSYFPTEWLVVMTPESSLDIWSQGVFHYWAKLGFPSPRLFLPEGYSAQQLSILWNELSPSKTYKIVDELPALFTNENSSY